MYGKLMDGILINAPNSLTVNNRVYYNPAAKMLIEQGYKEIEATPYPETEDNKYYTYSYEEQDDKIIKVWTEAEPPSLTPSNEDRILSLENKLNATMEAVDYLLLNEVNTNG